MHTFKYGSIHNALFSIHLQLHLMSFSLNSCFNFFSRKVALLTDKNLLLTILTRLDSSRTSEVDRLRNDKLRLEEKLRALEEKFRTELDRVYAENRDLKVEIRQVKSNVTDFLGVNLNIAEMWGALVNITKT